MTHEVFDMSAAARANALRERHIASAAEAHADIVSELKNYVFYHCIEIAPGIETPGYDWTRPFTERFAKIVPTIDFKDKRILDIGCRDGAQAIQMERAGAAEIHCIDNDLSPGLVNFLIPFLGSKIQCRELNVYDLGTAGLGMFDIVNCCGVLYHLQFPLWGLKQMRDAIKPGGMLILETSIINGIDRLPMLAYFAGKLSPYEGTSPTFFNIAGLRGSLELLDFEGFEVRDTVPQRGFDAKLRRFSKLGTKITCSRVILTCRRKKIATKSIERDYFEGTHHIHSASAS